MNGARWVKWLEHEFTDRKVRGSNPTSASRLPLSRLGQTGSIPALVPPSCDMAARHRKGLVFTRDSTEPLVYDSLQPNVLHTGRLLIQLALYSRYRACVQHIQLWDIINEGFS
ncbi:hypothetical protein T265_10192 [Opisthorchis viverrini]|uniref:Uncharacterized protein n=1 Tax=Opisthorchis viverrini TaxID=6198 RepID=A0A075A278_OPIVI|nr:hypothetical protein T265_10192 [Opisthorchis viverrini]KER21504.1 hypothetical protein T265_10192 [Opisthorchis viverrini]